MLFNNIERILILAPHVDDGEFGCGGTISKLIEYGKEVYYVTFTTAKKSIIEKYPKNITEIEVVKATETLGIKRDSLIVFDYEVRNFLQHRQDILENMVKINNDIKPDIIFMPSVNDTHQDHKVITEEGFRAFKKKSIFGYEIPWNNLSFNTEAFVFLEENHINKKIESLKCYMSQTWRLKRNLTNENFLLNLAKVRGGQIGAPYAEAFEVVRLIVK